MHTPLCNDALEFWPEGAPTDIDVSTLPAVGAITNPIRIPGMGQWLGFWGPSFSGLRVGYSATKTFPVINGLGVPYPKDPDGKSGLDVFLSRDAGGSGIVSVARFKTQEAAQAWGGRPTPSTASSSGPASLPNRSLAATETVPVGLSKTHVWNAGATYTTFLYATVRARITNAANVVIGPTVANALFPLRPGEAENFFVGGAIEFGFTGANGDILDIIEYGRV